MSLPLARHHVEDRPSQSRSTTGRRLNGVAPVGGRGSPCAARSFRQLARLSRSRLIARALVAGEESRSPSTSTSPRWAPRALGPKSRVSGLALQCAARTRPPSASPFSRRSRSRGCTARDQAEVAVPSTAATGRRVAVRRMLPTGFATPLRLANVGADLGAGGSRSSVVGSPTPYRRTRGRGPRRVTDRRAPWTDVGRL